MRKAHVERTVTMAITGHAIMDMNERYDTVDLQDKLEGVKRLEAWRKNIRQTLDEPGFQKVN